MSSGWVLALMVFTVITTVTILLDVSPALGGALLFVIVFVMLTRGLARQTIQPVS